MTAENKMESIKKQIQLLKNNLQACQAQFKIVSAARVPTCEIIDLQSPDGNIFYIMGLCQRLAREHLLPQQEYEKFEKKLNRLRSYDERLDLCQKWFGLVYVNRKQGSGTKPKMSLRKPCHALWQKITGKDKGKNNAKNHR